MDRCCSYKKKFILRERNTGCTRTESAEYLMETLLNPNHEEIWEKSPNSNNRLLKNWRPDIFRSPHNIYIS